MSNKASRPAVSAGPTTYNDYGVELTYTVTVPVAVTVVKRLTQGGHEVLVKGVGIDLEPAAFHGDAEAAGGVWDRQDGTWSFDDAVVVAAYDHVEALLDGGGQLTLWED